MPGYGPLPAWAVQDLAQTATLKPLTIPNPTAPPEPGYRPSKVLAEFVRMRDVTAGATHPSNLKCLCCWPSSDRQTGDHHV